jgi:hypothetical protein
MSKETPNPEPAPDYSQEPNGEQQPLAPEPEGDPANVFDSPNKTVLPPKTREEVLKQDKVAREYIGGNSRNKRSLYADPKKGRKGHRG